MTMAMNDTLWFEASRDEDHERLTAALERAEGALASKFAFVSEATTQTAYENRLAVVASNVEAGVAAATVNDPVLFAVVHQALLTQWESDFQRIAAIRRQEAQRRNHRRGYERNAARRQGAYEVGSDTIAANPGEQVQFRTPNGAPSGVFGTVVNYKGNGLYDVRMESGYIAVDVPPIKLVTTNGDGLLAARVAQGPGRRTAGDRRLPSELKIGDKLNFGPLGDLPLTGVQDLGGGWWRLTVGEGDEASSVDVNESFPGMDMRYEVTGAKRKVGFAIGDKVEVQWESGAWDPATVTGVDGDVVEYVLEFGGASATRANGDPRPIRMASSMGRGNTGRGQFKTANTQGEADALLARFDGPLAERVNVMIGATVYGPGYNRNITENLYDAAKFFRGGVLDDAEYFVRKAEAQWVAQNGGEFLPAIHPSKDGVGEQGRLDGLASKTAVGEFQRADRGWVRRGEGLLSGGQANWVHVTGPDDQSPARVTYPTGYESNCSWCYLNAPHSEDAHVESIASYTASKRPLTGAWIAPFVDQVRTTGMATIGFTGRTGARRAITMVHEGSLVHWAVTDDSGEQEDGSGSGKSVRDTLEQAWDLLNTVLDKEPPPTGDIADQAQQAEKAVGEAVDAAGGDAAPAQPGAQEKAPDAPAPPAEGDAPADPKDDAKAPPAEGDDSAKEAPAPAKGDAPAGEDEKPDFIKDKGDDKGDGDPPQDAPAADDAESGDDGATANTPDSVVDQAEDNSLGDVLGVDPTTMQPGTRTTMTYTMGDGTTGSVEVTFIREDNEIFFFDGPNGEFGLGDRDGEWVDSEGNSFAFSEGDAVEEITGEDADTDAALTEIDLDVPVEGGEDVVVEDKDPDAGTPAEDAPADDKADGKPDFIKKDDEEDDDVKKAKEAMLRENPRMPLAVASRLAARAAAMAKVL